MRYRGYAPDEDWAIAVNHAVELHNLIVDGVTELSPNFKWDGIEQKDVRSKLENMGPLFCNVKAKRYAQGKCKEPPTIIFFWECHLTLRESL